MKVLLISPLPVYRGRPKPLWMPLGLAFIASCLIREGHEVSIFDRHARFAETGCDRDKVNSAMLDHVRVFCPDLIGLKTISPLIYDTVEIVDLIRRSYSGTIVAGGHHATAFPELTLKKIPGLNGVVSGEGEMPMVALAGGKDPAGISGVWWRQGDATITAVPSEQNNDLDSLPFPAINLLDMNYYTTRNFKAFHERYLSSACLLTSRGCTQNCDFCTESLTYGSGVRFHSTEYVIEWIQKVLTDYRVDGIYFHDNHFLFDEDRAGDICERIIERGLHRKFKWAMQARVDSINASILRLLKRAGCVSIEIGVESPLQNRLDSVNKAARVDDNRRAISLCRREGLSVYAYMIIGFPGESISDLEATLNWVKEVKPTIFNWRDLTIYPGTRLYEQMGNQYFEENDWDRKSIDSFFQARLPDTIPEASQTQWLRKHYTPYSTWRRCLAAVRQNSLITLLMYGLREWRTSLELIGWLLGRICRR